MKSSHNPTSPGLKPTLSLKPAGSEERLLLKESCAGGSLREVPTASAEPEEEDLKLVKKHNQFVFENEMKKAACNSKEVPPPKFESREGFFNDEFFYPKKKKEQSEIELKVDFDEVYKNEKDHCNCTVASDSPPCEAKKPSSDEKDNTSTAFVAEPKKAPQGTRAHSAIEAVIMNQMKRNQQESKMKKKAQKPESRKFHRLDESIDFALLRNHQRATTTEQKQPGSKFNSELPCNTSQRVGCKYYQSSSPSEASSSIQEETDDLVSSTGADFFTSFRNPAAFNPLDSLLKRGPSQSEVQLSLKQQNQMYGNSVKIIIRNNEFSPSHLKVPKGQIVEWSVGEGVEKNESSLYYFANRSHVICFDNLNAESNLLTCNSEPFFVRFLETGVYTYRCQIYTRMRGTIEVVEKLPSPPSTGSNLQIEAREFHPRPIRPIIPEAKSVTDIGQFFLNQAAIPVPVAQKQKEASPLSEERNMPSPPSKSCIFRFDYQSSGDSSDNNNVDTNGLLYVNKKCLQEIFDRSSGPQLNPINFNGQELQPLEEDVGKDRLHHDSDEEDEDQFIRDQRQSTKKEKSNQKPKVRESKLIHPIEEAPEEESGGSSDPGKQQKFSPFSMLFHSHAKEDEREQFEIDLVQQYQKEKQEQDFELAQRQQAKNLDRSKAIFIVRTLEPFKQGTNKSVGQKQASREFMLQSDEMEMARCPLVDQQYQQFTEFQRKEKKKVKKREYLKKKKEKLQIMQKDCDFDHQVSKAQMDVLRRYRWRSTSSYQQDYTQWQNYYQWKPSEGGSSSSRSSSFQRDQMRAKSQSSRVLDYMGSMKSNVYQRSAKSRDLLGLGTGFLQSRFDSQIKECEHL